MKGGARRRRVSMVAAMLLAGGCRGEKTRPHEAPEGAGASGASVCDAVERESEMKRALEALLGEHFILKYAVSFEDHEEIAARAKRAGARADSFFEVPILLDAPRGAIAAVLDGRGDLERLAPYVVQGSLDDLGEDGIALDADLADRLGATIGSTADLFSADPSPTLGPVPEVPPLRARVAALFRFPGDSIHHYGERFALTKRSTAQKLAAPGATNITGVRIWSDGVDAAKPDRWSPSLSASAYRVMSMDELNGSALDGAATAIRAGCKDGLPPSPHRAEARSLPHACEVATGLTRAIPVLYSLFGALREAPPRAAELEGAAKAASASRIARRIEADAILVTTSSARSCGITGVDAADEASFEGLVARGSMRDVLDGESIALGEQLAASLGVDVGDEIFVRGRPMDRMDEPTSFRPRVGAIVRLPANAGHEMESLSAWMASKSLRIRLHLPEDATTSIVAWASDRVVFEEAMAKTAYLGKATVRGDHLRAVSERITRACRDRRAP